MRKPAFTLVELMVVIGVVALVIAILLPSLARAHRAARTVRCLSNLHQLGIVNQIYQQDFPDWELPAHWGWSPSAAGWTPNSPPPLPASGPYRTWADIPAVWETLGPRKNSSRYLKQILCPDATLAQTDGNDLIGYGIGMSYNMNNSQLPGDPIGLAPDYFNGWRRGQLRSPSEKIQLIDAIGAVSVGGSPNCTMRYFMPTWGEVHYAPDHSNIVAYRHHNGACALYFDGHACWVSYSALVYDPTNPRTTAHRRQWLPTTP